MVRTKRAKQTTVTPNRAATGERPKPKLLAAENKPATCLAAPLPATEVAIRLDVGFGNSLFIRGEGYGLSWDKGVPLECVDASTWVWSKRDAKDKLTFKILLNDVVWAQGENLVLEAGQRIEARPQF